jgi:hypothetical protein
VVNFLKEPLLAAPSWTNVKASELPAVCMYRDSAVVAAAPDAGVAGFAAAGFAAAGAADAGGVSAAEQAAANSDTAAIDATM